MANSYFNQSRQPRKGRIDAQLKPSPHYAGEPLSPDYSPWMNGLQDLERLRRNSAMGVPVGQYGYPYPLPQAQTQPQPKQQQQPQAPPPPQPNTAQSPAPTAAPSAPPPRPVSAPARPAFSPPPVSPPRTPSAAAPAEPYTPHPYLDPHWLGAASGVGSDPSGFASLTYAGAPPPLPENKTFGNLANTAFGKAAGFGQAPSFLQMPPPAPPLKQELPPIMEPSPPLPAQETPKPPMRTAPPPAQQMPPPPPPMPTVPPPRSLSTPYGTGSVVYGPRQQPSTIEGIPSRDWFVQQAKRQQEGNAFANYDPQTGEASARASTSGGGLPSNAPPRRQAEPSQPGSTSSMNGSAFTSGPGSGGYGTLAAPSSRFAPASSSFDGSAPAPDGLGSDSFTSSSSSSGGLDLPSAGTLSASTNPLTGLDALPYHALPRGHAPWAGSTPRSRASALAAQALRPRFARGPQPPHGATASLRRSGPHHPDELKYLNAAGLAALALQPRGPGLMRQHQERSARLRQPLHHVLSRGLNAAPFDEAQDDDPSALAQHAAPSPARPLPEPPPSPSTRITTYPPSSSLFPIPQIDPSTAPSTFPEVKPTSDPRSSFLGPDAKDESVLPVQKTLGLTDATPAYAVPKKPRFEDWQKLPLSGPPAPEHYHLEIKPAHNLDDILAARQEEIDASPTSKAYAEKLAEIANNTGYKVKWALSNQGSQTNANPSRKEVVISIDPNSMNGGTFAHESDHAIKEMLKFSGYNNPHDSKPGQSMSLDQAVQASRQSNPVFKNYFSGDPDPMVSRDFKEDEASRVTNVVTAERILKHYFEEQQIPPSERIRLPLESMMSPEKFDIQSRYVRNFTPNIWKRHPRNDGRIPPGTEYGENGFDRIRKTWQGTSQR